MESIDELIYNTLGWEWVLDYASILLIVAAALAIVLILTIIIAAAVGHSKNKKIRAQQKINNEQSNIIANHDPLTDSSELRNEIRNEMTPVLREEINRNYAEKYGNQISELNAASAEKDKRIEELSAQLAQASENRNNAELGNTISELNETNKELRNELNAMRVENASLRNQITGQQQAASPRPAPVEKERPARAKKQEPVVSTVEAYADDDDDEEYDNEFGDETSDVKVTLKYDRIKMNWVIFRSDTTRAYRRFATKQEAIVIAKDLARRLHAQLVVHKRDGKFQKV